MTLCDALFNQIRKYQIFTNKQAFNRTVNNLEAAFHFVAVVEEREMLSNNNDK